MKIKKTYTISLTIVILLLMGFIFLTKCRRSHLPECGMPFISSCRIDSVYPDLDGQAVGRIESLASEIKVIN